MGLQLVAHVVLLLLVPAEYADFLDIGFKEMLKNCVAEGAGTSGD